MTHTDIAARRELDRMRADLSRLRSELPDLERDAKESTGATNARRGIGRLEEGIRRYCRERGLDLPEDVSEGFEVVMVASDHDAIRTLARDCAHY